MITFILSLFRCSLQRVHGEAQLFNNYTVWGHSNEWPFIISSQQVVRVQLRWLGMPESVISLTCEWGVRGLTWSLEGQCSSQNPQGQQQQCTVHPWSQASDDMTEARTDKAFLRKGEQRVGGGAGKEEKIEGGVDGGHSPGAHIWFPLKRRELGKIPLWRNLSPISVEPADKGQGKYMAERHTVNNQNKQTGKCQQRKDMNASPILPLWLLFHSNSDFKSGIRIFFFLSRLNSPTQLHCRINPVCEHPWM